MDPTTYTLFATAIGPCAIIWGARGIVGVQLPQESETATRARVMRRFPGALEAPPDETVSRVVAAIVDLLDGRPADLSHARLDLTRVSKFDQAIYAATRTVPPGATVTYGAIASRLGEPGAARAVGRAMGANPFPIIVPCHRVLAADGGMGGFSAAGGVVTKARLLSIEGARTNDAPLLFDELPITVRPLPKAAKRRPPPTD